MNQFMHPNLHDPPLFFIFFHLFFQRPEPVRLFREPDPLRHRERDAERFFHVSGDRHVFIGTPFRVHLQKETGIESRLLYPVCERDPHNRAVVHPFKRMGL